MYDDDEVELGDHEEMELELVYIPQSLEIDDYEYVHFDDEVDDEVGGARVHIYDSDAADDEIDDIVNI